MKREKKIEAEMTADSAAAAAAAEQERARAAELAKALEMTQAKYEVQLASAQEDCKKQSEQFRAEVKKILEERSSFRTQCAELQMKLMVAEEETNSLKEKDRGRLVAATCQP